MKKTITITSREEAMDYLRGSRYRTLTNEYGKTVNEGFWNLVSGNGPWTYDSHEEDDNDVTGTSEVKVNTDKPSHVTWRVSSIVEFDDGLFRYVLRKSKSVFNGTSKFITADTALVAANEDCLSRNNYTLPRTWGPWIECLDGQLPDKNGGGFSSFLLDQDDGSWDVLYVNADGPRGRYDIPVRIRNPPASVGIVQINEAYDKHPYTDTRHAFCSAAFWVLSL